VNTIVKLLRSLIVVLSVGMFQQIICNGILTLQAIDFNNAEEVIDAIFAGSYIAVFSYVFVFKQLCV